MERKITIGEAAEGGAVGLWIHCETRSDGGALCGHSASLSIADALRRWSVNRRLDTLRFRCTRCDGPLVDVRPVYRGGGAGGGWHNT